MFRINTPADVANTGRVHIDTGDGVQIEAPVALAARLAALEYDSGWRDVSADLRLGWTGELHIRRIGHIVHWRCKDLLAGTGHAFYAPPAGMTSAQPGVVNMVQSLNIAPLFQLDSTGRLTRTYTAAALPGASWWTGQYVLNAGTPPPSTPPGVAVD